MKMKDSRISSPLLYKVCIGFMLLSLLLPMERSFHFPNNTIGVILFVANSFFALTAKRLFKKTDTAIKPEAKPEKLHTGGVFKIH